MIPSQFQFIPNHLWQSTMVAGIAGLLMPALSKNRAQIRYWLWFAASVKFLIPFSILVIAGSHFGRQAQAPMARPVTVAIEQLSQPFAVPVPAGSAPLVQTSPSVLPAILCMVWAIGLAFVVSSWWTRSRQIRAALRMASPLKLPFDLVIDIKVISSPAFLEPGVFGIWRPVLLLPEGIIRHLTPAQLEAIVAHELCHVRRRDNLASLIHMAVEALFWFHPLVWWLSARVMEERERACDEEVLRMGSQPQAYAEGILKICELYLASPLQSVAGVTGGNLKERIEAIMANRIVPGLNFAKKAALAVAGVTVLMAPFAVGVINAPGMQAQSPVTNQAKALLPPAYTYEVVSIHPSSPDQRGSGIGPSSQGGLRTLNTPVMMLLTFAYNVHDFQFVGAPGWVSTDRFDVSFTPDQAEIAPGRGAAIKEQQEYMGRNQQRMQAVLRDRFGLILSVQTRELPIYALTQTKSGHKLSPSDGKTGADLRGGRGGLLTGNGASIEMPADELSSVLGRLVTDETGLGGQYDFKLQWNPRLNVLSDTVANLTSEVLPPETGASIFTALTDQLGLRLESKKGSGTVYVIERIEKPSPN